MLRRVAACASLVLVATVVALVPASPAPAATYTERWCISSPAPCIESFSLNGVAQPMGGPVRLQLEPATDLGGYREMGLSLDPDHPAAAGDLIDVTINTGTGFVPERMFGQMGLLDVDTSTSGGHRLVRITGRAVRWAEGCDSAAPWPWPCGTTATADRVLFSAGISDLDDPTDTSIGMYVGTNAAFNGIFFTEQPDGTDALSTELVAPHLFSDGSTLVVGSTRFRVSYAQMRRDMGIPNPETLTPGSLAGTINGGTGGGAFTTWHDPDGGGFFIQASGFTFSLKRLRVAAAHIVPTRPAVLRSKRVGATRGKIIHSLSTPRGARVTGYRAVCKAPHAPKVKARGTAGSKKIVVRGLRRATAYSCKVAASSAVGQGPWSARAKVRARP